MLFPWTSQPGKAESKAYKGSKGILMAPLPELWANMVREGWVLAMGHSFALPLLGKESQALIWPRKTSSPLGRNERGTLHVASSEVRTLNSSLVSGVKSIVTEGSSSSKHPRTMPAITHQDYQHVT